MKKIVRKLQKVKLPASNIKEMDLSNWEADRTAREQPTQSANIDDRRKENDGPRRKQEPVLDKDNESEPKSDSSNITSKNITSRENPNPEPLKPMSDFVSRTINSPIRSERSMPGPQQKTADRIIAFRRARGLDEEAAPRRTAILAAQPRRSEQPTQRQPEQPRPQGQLRQPEPRRSEQPTQRQPEQPRPQRQLEPRRSEPQRQLEPRRSEPQRDTRTPAGDVYPSREDERQITNTPSVSNSEPESREPENNQRVSAQPKQKPVETPKPQNPYERHGANEPDSSAASFFRADKEAQKMGLVQGPNNPKKVDEEIANAVGTGNIAGMGVPLEGKPENWAEPPVRPRKRKKYKDRTKDEQNDTTADIAMIRRADPLGEELETGSFAGNKTFVVNDDMFIKARMEKKRGQHWKTYLGGDKYEMIRQHANKNKKAPIILQNEKTGAMMYARYGGKHDNKRDS